MTSRLERALRVWDARRRRSAATTAYAAYVAILVIIVVVVPLARAAWLALIDSPTVEFLASAPGTGLVTAVVTLSWAAFVIAGRFLGPAVLNPLLTFVTVGSDLPRRRVFARPLRLAFSVLVLIFTAGAGACGAALIVGGVWSLGQCVLFAASGVSVGLIAGVFWLLGQVFPRAAIIIGACLMGGSAVALLWPASGVVVPATWVGLLFGGAGRWQPVVGLAALAVVTICAVPVLLERLTIDDVMRQSVRRDATINHAALLQLSELSALYQAKPTAGRFRRAVRVGRPTLVSFLVADLIGATRTPGRLAAAVAGAVGAGALLTVAVALQDTGGAVLGAVGGALLFAAIGPMTDGIRHAVASASGRSIYGVNDELLLLAHSAMPLVVVTSLAFLAAAVTSTVCGVPLMVGALTAASVGVVTIGTRIANALKGPMPLSLLAAIPTPFGDPMAMIRVAWAVDGVLVAGFVGASASAGAIAPALMSTAATIVIFVGIARWRHRAH